MRYAWLVPGLALGLLLGSAMPLCAQNSISGLRQSVRRPPAEHRLPRSDQRRQQSEDDPWQNDEDDNSTSNNSIGDWNPIGQILLAPFTAPRFYLQDRGQEVFFTNYPFEDHYSGNLVVEPLWSPDLKKTRLRFGTEYGDNFDRQQKITTRLQFDTTTRIGIDTSFDYLREQLGSGAHDQTWIGDINLTWRFAQSEHSEFRSGLGYNWLADSGNSGKGFNFTYGATFFLNKPSVLDLDIDLGRLGNADLTRIKTTYSRYIKRIKLSIGYEYLHIGAFQANYFTTGLSLDF